MISKHKRKKNLTFEEIDGEIKILDENQDAIVSLNEAASLLWNNLSSFKSNEELAEVLLSEYSLTKDQALVDIKSFLKLLNDHQLLSSEK